MPCLAETVPEGPNLGEEICITKTVPDVEVSKVAATTNEESLAFKYRVVNNSNRKVDVPVKVTGDLGADGSVELDEEFVHTVGANDMSDFTQTYPHQAPRKTEIKLCAEVV